MDQWKTGKICMQIFIFILAFPSVPYAFMAPEPHFRFMFLQVSSKLQIFDFSAVNFLASLTIKELWISPEHSSFFFSLFLFSFEIICDFYKLALTLKFSVALVMECLSVKLLMDDLWQQDSFISGLCLFLAAKSEENVNS